MDVISPNRDGTMHSMQDGEAQVRNMLPMLSYVRNKEQACRTQRYMACELLKWATADSMIHVQR